MEALKNALDYTKRSSLTGGERAILLGLAAVQTTWEAENPGLDGWILPRNLASQLGMSSANAQQMLCRPRLARILIPKKVLCTDRKWRTAYKVKVES